MVLFRIFVEALIHKVAADRFCRTIRSVVHMPLVNDDLHVLTCCYFGVVQSTSDLAIAQAFARQLNCVDFMLAEIRYLSGTVTPEDVQQ